MGIDYAIEEIAKLREKLAEARERAEQMEREAEELRRQQEERERLIREMSERMAREAAESAAQQEREEAERRHREAAEQRTEEAVRRIAQSIHDECQTSRPTCTQVAEAIASARIALVAVQLTRLPSPRAGDEPRCHPWQLLLALL